ncbi:MAG: xanthine dehydrogenase family protein subunit M [Acidobacteria bacterium]|nr:xanthine dehydrogenase family protein subunit M [Acidobacteriota bacterium]
MIPPKFEYFAPTSLQEAVSLLAGYGEEAKLLAGGQSLLALMKLRLASPKYLIDLGRIGDLNYIREEGGRIAIGALTTYSQIKRSHLLQSKCALLPQTATWVGDVQIRNRGTLGGSLAHADPAGDMPAAILALDAELKAVGPQGQRWIQAEEFFLTTFTTALAPDEILTEIRVPVLNGQKTAYLKSAPRPSDFAVVGVAVRLQAGQNGTCEEIAIGITGVTDRAYRAKGVEKALKGKKLEPQAVQEAASTVTQGVEVNENIHASRNLRAHLARLFVARAIQAAR